MKKSLKIGLAVVGSAAVLAFGTHLYGHFAPTANAAEKHAHGAAKAPAHDHAGHGGGGGLTQLALNDGQKWQTDAALRQGMAKVRSHILAAVPRIHEGRFTNEDYAALAGQLEAAVLDVIKACKLPPAADAQIHFVIAEIFAGANAMKEDGDRHAGAVQVLGALQAYPKYFDDAEFGPLD